MTNQIGSGTAQGVIDYLDSLVEKGRSRSGVVNPLKTAVSKVLEVTEGENAWRSVDVTSLDVEDTMSRFKNKTLSNYTKGSYDAYQSRMSRAIGWYKNFLADPGWVPSQSNNSPNASKSKPALKAPEKSTDSTVPHTTQQPVTSQPMHEIDSIAYPFPLESGKLARFYVPKDMTKSDVERISGFLNALVVEKRA
jgi:hypothetical protein